MTVNGIRVNTELEPSIEAARVRALIARLPNDGLFLEFLSQLYLFVAVVFFIARCISSCWLSLAWLRAQYIFNECINTPMCLQGRDVSAERL